MRRVVITGMGIVSPLGHSVAEFFTAVANGKSGIGPITAFDARTFPTTIAGEVKNFNLANFVRDTTLWTDAKQNSRFAAAASQQALTDSGVLDDARIDRTRFGVYLGTGEGVQDFNALIGTVTASYDSKTGKTDDGAYCREGLQRFHTGREYEQELHTSPAHLAAYFGLEGPNFNSLTACAGGTQAVGEACELIRGGDADLMLTGGSHSMVHPIGITGFNLLTALSKFRGPPEKASRPFDLTRDGFVIGEGAGVVVLEELEHAKKRGARIYAELTGYGVTADAYRVTDPHPQGRGAITCMANALKDAKLNRDDIGYINAHGTSTQMNDRIETLATKAVFGEQAYRIPISSTKSMIGHLIGAAGGVELIVCVEALRKGVLPPTINLETPDPDCDLDYIPHTAREKRVRHAMSNSFGFGGQNATVIVSAV
jgi:3-oxoacyl-[acyl-carrier-protein] synthase II